MKFTSLLIALLIIVSVSAKAQLGFGGEVGLNGSKDMVKYKGETQTKEFRYGLRAGGLADIALTDNFYFQPGIYYVANGFKSNFTGGHDEWSINSLEIPMNITYKIGQLGSNRFFVGAGPYIGFNTGGYVLTNEPPQLVNSKRDINIGGKIVDDVRTFDAGLGINAGYQLTAGLFFRARTQFGLINMYPLGNSDNSIRSFSFGITAGYIFYRRNKEGVLIIKRERKKAELHKGQTYRSDN